ncbi:MAG TPA: formate hydrogenlyase maturation protein HycH [Anaerolineae bacterium]|nr:formate hydrogenlyase maturation protein HycH [Anaerolineae bacterium]
MAEQVVFYQLTHKFVNQEQAIPEGPRQVMYYSLAIGHHVGVLDCFQKLVEIPLEDYRHWLSQIPEGTGRHKLEGLLKWGEIEINQSHANDLLSILKSTAETPWTEKLAQCLHQMSKEPALYLMARKTA